MSSRVQLYSPEFFADPYAFYGRLREEDPVHWHPEHRMWILTRYEDVSRVARQPRVYSSRLSALDTLPPSPPVRPEDAALTAVTDAVHVEEFIQMDPPCHTGKRAAVSPRFAPAALETWRPVVREIIAGLLDAVAADGAMDVRAAVARPLPLLVVSRLMGIAPADVEMIAEQARRRMAAVLSIDEDRLGVAVSGFRETAAYLDDVLDDRHACPVTGDVLGDVLGDMVDAERAGSWTRAETLANAMMIIDAGHETTVQLVCNATLALLTRPDQWALLCEDPVGRAPGAVDEVLRFDPPLHALRRIVTQDVEVRGHTLRAGDRVLAVVAAANRDPRRFPDPDRFDIGRTPNSHLAFGAGAHYCLGQYLARMEGQEYLVALAQRFPDARPPDPASIRYAPVPRVRSVMALPITFTKETALASVDMENRATVSRTTCGWRKADLDRDAVRRYWRDVHSPAIARRAGVHWYRHSPFDAVDPAVFAHLAGIELTAPADAQLMWQSDVVYLDEDAVATFVHSPDDPQVTALLLADIELIVHKSTTYRSVDDNARTYVDITEGVPTGPVAHPTYGLFFRARGEQEPFRAALRRLAERWSAHPGVLRLRLNLFDVPDMEAERRAGYPVKTHPLEQQYQAWIELVLADAGVAAGLTADGLAEQVATLHAYPVPAIYTFVHGGAPTLIGLRGYAAHEAIEGLGADHARDPRLLEWMYGKVPA